LEIGGRDESGRVKEPQRIVETIGIAIPGLWIDWIAARHQRINAGKPSQPILVIPRLDDQPAGAAACRVNTSFRFAVQFVYQPL
jgi:hypothetical protein